MGGTREESVSDRHALRLDGSTRATLMLRHRRERSTRAVTVVTVTSGMMRVEVVRW